MFNLKIKYYDKNLIILNKPVGIDTNNLIHNFYFLLNNKIPNFGILNRLDKYTSGLICIAKNIMFYFFFKKMLILKLIKKNYLTIIKEKIYSGVINLSIKKKEKNFILKNSKKSITYYNIIKCNKKKSLINVCIKTGRTHQIRLHFNYIKHNILYENYYEKKFKYCNTLHFKKIFFYYPYLKKNFFISCELSREFKKILLINLL